MKTQTDLFPPRQGGERRARQPALAIGEVLNDCYELRRVIGVGGMGHVYEAHDRRLNRIVAIKVGHRDIDDGALIREARVMAAFRHPGLPTVHALDCHQGVDYVVMEYLRGQTLSEFLRHGRPVLEVAETHELLLAVARSLSVLHGATLVHRDVKPDNIMIVGSDRTVLCDFSISDMERFIPELGIVGSPHYIAPEAALGEITAGNAHLMDIYALGVLGFRLLTGTTPFSGDKVIEILDQAMCEDAPPLRSLRRDIPISLAALIDSMIARIPSDRPSSIAQVVSQLECMDLTVEPASTSKDECDVQPIRLLVADDESVIWELMSYVLEDKGYEIIYVEDGEQALKEFEKAPFDIVITDKNMPVLDGLGLVRAIKRIAPDTGIIMITGYPSKEAANEALDSGVARFMEKPFDIDELAAAVAELAVKRRIMHGDVPSDAISI